MTKQGFKDASQDATTIENWWKQRPGALIGMPTGAASNILVIDIDNGAETPDDVLSALQMEYGDFADAPLVRTPSGGLHIYFQHDPRVRINGSGKTWKLQVDWRGEGGFVIVPPSTSDKGAYVLLRDGVLAPPPPEMVAAIVAAQGGPSLAVAGGTASLQYQKTLKEIAEQITANRDWHANTNVLIARWTAAYGIPPDEWVNLAPFLQQPGFTLEQTIKEIHVSAQGAFRKYAPEIASKTPEGGLRLWGIDDLESRPAPDWLIGGVLPEGALAVLYGDSNTFKTFAALDMALSVAHGVAWMTRAVKPAPVLYVLGEGQGGFGGRVKAWRQTWDDRECAGFWTLLQSLSMPDKVDMTALLDAIGALPAVPKMIVIDTLARNFGPGNPDATQDMTRFVMAMDTLRQATGAAVLIIHHAGKNRELGARNSSVLRASLDVEIRAEREEGAETVRLLNTKQKDWDEFQPLFMRMEKVSFTDSKTGEMTTSLAPRWHSPDPLEQAAAEAKTAPPSKHDALVLSLIGKAKTLTFGEVVERSMVHGGTISRVLKGLVSRGALASHGSKPVIYYIPEKEEEEQ